MMFYQTTGLFYDLSLPAKQSAFYQRPTVQRNYCHFPVYKHVDKQEIHQQIINEKYWCAVEQKLLLTANRKSYQGLVNHCIKFDVEYLRDR